MCDQKWCETETSVNTDRVMARAAKNGNGVPSERHIERCTDHAMTRGVSFGGRDNKMHLFFRKGSEHSEVVILHATREAVREVVRAKLQAGAVLE